MLNFATLLIVLSSCSVAWAGVCQPLPPVELYSDAPFDLQVFFDGKPAVALPLQVYAGATLVHSAIADKNGRVRLGLLPRGKYRVVIPRKETLELTVLQQKSNLNGPFLSWYLFPKSKYTWLKGKRVPGIPCPEFGIKED